MLGKEHWKDWDDGLIPTVIGYECMECEEHNLKQSVKLRKD